MTPPPAPLRNNEWHVHLQNQKAGSRARLFYCLKVWLRLLFEGQFVAHAVTVRHIGFCGRSVIHGLALSARKKVVDRLLR